MSSSGTPFRTPAGHMPGWTSSVHWKTANALKPETYTDLVRDKSAVVHTIGTLLPNTQYKDALRRGDIPSLLGALYQSMRGSNPLSEESNLYDVLNRDTGEREGKLKLSAMLMPHQLSVYSRHMHQTRRHQRNRALSSSCPRLTSSNHLSQLDTSKVNGRPRPN